MESKDNSDQEIRKKLRKLINDDSIEYEGWKYGTKQDGCKQSMNESFIHDECKQYGCKQELKLLLT